MMDISIYNYKNYYNRLGKGHPTLAEYNSTGILLNRFSDIQFNPNDGVTTELILDFNLDSIDPDYLIASENNTIQSRWFIMESNRTRSGQYRVKLKRDVLYDFKREISESSGFIERGWVPESDPAIYNSEPIALNQIKTREIPLKDYTNCNWIVGYFSSQNSIDGQTLVETVTGNYGMSNVTDVTSIADIPYYELINDIAIQSISDYDVELLIASSLAQYGPIYYTGYTYSPFNDTNFSESGPWNVRPSRFLFDDDVYAHGFGNWASVYFSSAYKSFLLAKISQDINVRTDIDYADLRSLNNKVYHDTSTNKYYKFHVNSGNAAIESRLTGNVLYNSTSYADIVSKVNLYTHLTDNEQNLDEVKITGTFRYYRAALEEITGQTTTTKISSTRLQLTDAPYCMFCIPYMSAEGGGVTIRYNWSDEIETVPSEMLNIAQKIAEQYSGAGWLYDIQVLPYCPRQDLYALNSNVDISALTEDYGYNWINDSNNNKIGAIIWCTESQGKFTVNQTLTAVTNKKVSNCCDVYRLNAPNYNSSYEFSVAKNNNVSYFEVEYEYKPFNPYIHINPYFGGLYGIDFNDARGLICTGDYSLSIVSNAWTTYQLQNVNFQKVFDRQIENMDVNHTYNLIESITGAVAGTATGAIYGGIEGGIGGAVASGVMGAVGGIADVALGEARYAESKDFAQDMFAYNIQNVKAQANTLSKVTALTPTNKMFPFIEYFAPTQKERQLFINYLNLKGMNIGRVDALNDYIIDGKYLKAQIIRMPTLHQDYHIAAAIAAELDKGVYY